MKKLERGVILLNKGAYLVGSLISKDSTSSLAPECEEYGNFAHIALKTKRLGTGLCPVKDSQGSENL